MCIKVTNVDCDIRLLLNRLTKIINQEKFISDSIIHRAIVIVVILVHSNYIIYIQDISARYQENSFLQNSYT